MKSIRVGHFGFAEGRKRTHTLQTLSTTSPRHFTIYKGCSLGITMTDLPFDVVCHCVGISPRLIVRRVPVTDAIIVTARFIFEFDSKTMGDFKQNEKLIENSR